MTLKLNKIINEEISERVSSLITGGADTTTCQCGCCYSDQGGSSTHENGAANAEHGYRSPCGGGAYLKEVEIAEERP